MYSNEHPATQGRNAALMYEWLERDLTDIRSMAVRGVHAQLQVLYLNELSLLGPLPFRTSNGTDIQGDRCWAVDANGRLHKLVGGAWIPQTHDGSPSYVVRVQ